MKNWNKLFSVDDLIVYEDDSLLIVNKPPSVPSQPDHSENLDVLSWVQNLKKKKYHLLTRLDRPVSGLITLCNVKNVTAYSNMKFEKKYLAVVTKTEDEEKTLKHYLKREGRRKKAYLSETERPGYKYCELSYSIKKQLDNYSVVEVTLATGRFHQIRAQLAGSGLPIRGDVKYGARRGNKDRSIDLHAYSIEIPEIGLNEVVAPLGRNNLWSGLAEFWKEGL